LARKLKQLSARYSRSVDLINVGAYQAGSDPLLDEAILMHTHIDAFLQQGIQEQSKVNDSLSGLAQLLQRVGV
jgi:flagellum-specific ATP synthase